MTTLVFPLACFIGLTVGGAEVTVSGYTRQPVTLAYCSDGVTIANVAAVSWPHATASWGTVDGVGVWDATTGGVLLASPPAVAPVTIAAYDIARVPAAGVTASYDPIPRPFGTGAFGTHSWGTLGMALNGVAVMVERGFDQQHVCAPGVWAPGPFSRAA